MNPEERTGFIITAIAILTIPFFFITAVLGSYREVQPEFLQDIPILDFLISKFPWNAVVLFFTSILVYGTLIYFGWIGYCLYKGKIPELKKQKRFIDFIYNRNKQSDNRDFQTEEQPDIPSEIENGNEEEIHEKIPGKEETKSEDSKFLKDFI
jgi:hypothetical protein